MGRDALWAILIGACGTERARIALTDVQNRGDLPLKRIAEEGLKRDATAVILARPASNHDCQPCAAEVSAIYAAKRTLDQIGLRLHDYLLWHDAHCVSLRAAGIL